MGHVVHCYPFAVGSVRVVHVAAYLAVDPFALVPNVDAFDAVAVRLG